MNRQSFLSAVVLASALTLFGGKEAFAQDGRGGGGLIELPGAEVPNAKIWIGSISGWQSNEMDSVMVIHDGDPVASGSATPPDEVSNSELSMPQLTGSQINKRFGEDSRIRDQIGEVKGKIGIKVYNRSFTNHAAGQLKISITAKAVSGVTRSAAAQIVLIEDAYAVAPGGAYHVVPVSKTSNLPQLNAGSNGPTSIRISGSYTLNLSAF